MAVYEFQSPSSRRKMEVTRNAIDRASCVLAGRNFIRAISTLYASLGVTMREMFFDVVPFTLSARESRRSAHNRDMVGVTGEISKVMSTVSLFVDAEKIAFRQHHPSPRLFLGTRILIDMLRGSETIQST
jgi:hypothetical protein